MSGQSVELGNGGQKLESCDGNIAIRLKKNILPRSSLGRVESEKRFRAMNDSFLVRF